MESAVVTWRKHLLSLIMYANNLQGCSYFYSISLSATIKTELLKKKLFATLSKYMEIFYACPMIWIFMAFQA